MAQEVGVEPTTSRLTAGCSTTELLLNTILDNPIPGVCLGKPRLREASVSAGCGPDRGRRRA